MGPACGGNSFSMPGGIFHKPLGRGGRCRSRIGCGSRPGKQVRVLRFDFGDGAGRGGQFDFDGAVGVDFAQEDGTPGGDLDIACVDAFQDDWEADGGEENDLPGPSFRLPGEAGEVEGGGQQGRRGRRGRGACGRLGCGGGGFVGGMLWQGTGEFGVGGGWRRAGGWRRRGGGNDRHGGGVCGGGNAGGCGSGGLRRAWGWRFFAGGIVGSRRRDGGNIGGERGGCFPGGGGDAPRPDPQSGAGQDAKKGQLGGGVCMKRAHKMICDFVGPLRKRNSFCSSAPVP